MTAVVAVGKLFCSAVMPSRCVASLGSTKRAQEAEDPLALSAVSQDLGIDPGNSAGESCELARGDEGLNAEPLTRFGYLIPDLRGNIRTVVVVVVVVVVAVFITKFSGSTCDDRVLGPSFDYSVLSLCITINMYYYVLLCITCPPVAAVHPFQTVSLNYGNFETDFLLGFWVMSSCFAILAGLSRHILHARKPRNSSGCEIPKRVVSFTSIDPQLQQYSVRAQDLVRLETMQQ